MSNSKGDSFSVVIPAAGRSSRMGSFKPLLPFHSTTVIGQVLSVAQRVSELLVVVTGYRSAALKNALALGTDTDNNILSVYNDRYWTGMFSSIRCGVRELCTLRAGAGPVFVALADMPWLMPEDYEALAHRYAKGDCDAVRFMYRSVPGHPVLLSPVVAEAVRNASEDSTMPQILRRFRVCTLDSHEPRVVRDIDTPADYQSE